MRGRSGQAGGVPVTKHVVFVSGLSGAGRSEALKAFEDLGYYCVDNLPIGLLAALLQSLEAREAAPTRLALGVDSRDVSAIDGLESKLGELKAKGWRPELLFLDCEDATLLRRYSASRRPHPMHAEADGVARSIEFERERLAPLRALASLHFDTSDLTVHDLRRLIVEHVSHGGAPLQMWTRLLSFGFAYGVPMDADLIFDVRFLPNPHFVEALRPGTGLDAAVAEFVLQQEEAQSLLKQLESLLGWLLPRYEREGKANLTIAIGCTGGRHRSVALVEALHARLAEMRTLSIKHRESARWNRPR